MPAAVAIPGIVGALGVGGSIFGAHKQAQAQNNALKAQQQANREAMNRAQAQEAAKQRMAKARWADYTNRLKMWYQANPDATKRYGYLPGYQSSWSQPAAGAAGAPGAAPGGAGGGSVTLAGGRQVPQNEYDAYVARRDKTPLGGGSFADIVRGGIRT